MNPAVAGLCGFGIAAVYVPTLRDQIRDGEVPIPMTGNIFPIKVRRNEHPFVYWASVAVQIALMLVIIAGSLMLIAQGFQR